MMVRPAHPLARIRPPLALPLLCCAALSLGWSGHARPADGGAGGGAGSAVAPVKTATPSPSLSQTGSIGSVGSVRLEGQAAAKTLHAKPRLESRPEKAVAAPKEAADPGTRPASPPMAPLPRSVQQQVAARLRSLGACRRDVARDKHMPTAQVTAGSLLLRWTIEGTGTVSAPEVVAQTPVDPAIMECVKRTITSWTFPPPDEGSLSVERRYRFSPTK